LTKSIPNGLSSEDLMRMLAEARPEPSEECTCDNSIDPQSDDYEERIFNCADKFLELATDEIKDPMVHKVMMILIANNFIRFHNQIAEHKIEEHDHAGAVAWGRDAGKFQAITNILATVDCGENDFTCIVE
tara:strand:- start:269 stop:661 length:393 start_codon:yes stop_codon:yes gene_type:complete